MMVVLAALLGQDNLLALAVLLVVTIPLAWAWQRLAFLRVSYTRRLSETRVFEGERVTLSITVKNAKWLPLAWIRIIDQMPLVLEPKEKKLAPSSIPLMGVLETRASLLSN